MISFFDPDNARHHIDPYPYYKFSRERTPIRLVSRGGQRTWQVTCHKDVVALARDKRVGTQLVAPQLKELLASAPPGTLPPSACLLHRHMLAQDPPEHTRLRKLLNRAFTPASIKLLRPQVEAIFAECFEPVRLRPEFDLVEDVANPYPALVVASLLGLPKEDVGMLREWALVFGHQLDSAIAVPGSGAMATGASAYDYFDDVVSRRRRNLGEDLISVMLRAQDDGATMTHDEVIATCVLLSAAGHFNTTALLGLGTRALLQAPSLYRKLCEDPRLMPAAIEELLRFDSPVQVISRRALETIEYEGHRFLQDDELDLYLGAGNRDPEAFPEPDAIDFTRSTVNHVSFGQGIHICIGNALTRLEALVAFERITQALPALSLVENGWRLRAGFVHRGLESLRVRTNL